MLKFCFRVRIKMIVFCEEIRLITNRVRVLAIFWFLSLYRYLLVSKANKIRDDETRLFVGLTCRSFDDTFIVFNMATRNFPSSSLIMRNK